jgi:chaperone modulatory protein CbpM
MIMDERSVVSEVRRVSLRELRLWVREGWVQPAQGDRGPVFDEVDVARVRLLCDLRKEMALPIDALPVVLTLIDRLHETRRDLQHLVDALAEQPKDVRRSIAEQVRKRHAVAGAKAGD